MQKILEDVYRFEDSCNVYVVRSGSHAVLIDFGAGDVLDHLSEIGVEQIDAVLMTHHHRDQGQGLPRAVAAGIPIYVPHVEQELFAHADEHWQAREIYVNYNMRQDRFSLLHSVPIAGTLLDYEARTFGGLRFEVIPTPGHTTGSIALLAQIASVRVAFTGDLIAAPGKVWSLSATQWTYNGAEGAAYSISSLLDLRERAPERLLPSHGAPMDEPQAAIDLLVERLVALLNLRGHNLNLLDLIARPYEPITPHLLRHRASVSNCYVLLSDSGKALFIDFGYDMETGLALGVDRAARRPWLRSIPALKRQFGIDKIDVVLPTHFHDDHVAGINHLSRVEGAQVWCPELFADIFEHPARYDLPCIWYDPIPVDRRLPLETPFQWEEYRFRLHHLPGHTLYAVAIEFEVDGQRVLATGDQYQGEGGGVEFNYVYPNRFRSGDYVLSAELYARAESDLIITGHWQPYRVASDYFDRLRPRGLELDRLHRALLPDTVDLGAETFLARLEPYQAEAAPGQALAFSAEIRNPFDRAARADLTVVAPEGWHSDPLAPLMLAAGETAHVSFCVTPPAAFAARRERIALDVTIDGQRFGQQAEALISAVSG